MIKLVVGSLVKKPSFFCKGKSFPRHRYIKANDSDGDDPKANDSDGDDPKAKDSDGDDPKANDSDGDDPKASDSDGDDPKANDSDGDDPKVIEQTQQLEALNLVPERRTSNEFSNF